MRKIGEGYYYHVYDLDNGRVLKKQKSKLRCFLFILVSNRFRRNSYRVYQTAQKNIQAMRQTYQTIAERVTDKALLGNPVFLNGIDYEQDKVFLCNDFLKSHSYNDAIQLIDQYIELIKEFWKYGVNEDVFNFHVNAGLTHDKKLILIDFNEVSFNTDTCKAAISEKKFLERFAYRTLSPELKMYYKQKMSEEITVENLEKYWGLYQK